MKPDLRERLKHHMNHYWGNADLKKDVQEAIEALSVPTPVEVESASYFLREQARICAPLGQLSPEGQEQIASWFYQIAHMIEKLSHNHQLERQGSALMSEEILELQARIEELEK